MDLGHVYDTKIKLFVSFEVIKFDTIPDLHVIKIKLFIVTMVNVQSFSMYNEIR